MHSFVISLYFSPTYTIDYAAKTLLLNTPLKESSTVSFVNHYYIFSNFTTYYYKTNKFIIIMVMVALLLFVGLRLLLAE